MIKNKYSFFIILMMMLFTILFPFQSYSKEKTEKKDEKQEEAFKIPSHVLSIEKENTYPNSTEDQEIVEASEFTKGLIKDVEMPVDNPTLIKMLNESAISPSPISIGYRGMIYLGRWALNYKSLSTTVNWEYQLVNENELNNFGGEQVQTINYNQQMEKEVNGALTNKIASPEDIKKMMLMESKEKTNYPLSYTTVIGKSTKKDNQYNVPSKKQASLKAYAPAVNEKGQVTFGEVYIQLRGSNKTLVIKNVTKQGIGAWIPIQDHLSFSFQLK